MPISSRIPGFYRLPLAQRRTEIARLSSVEAQALEEVLDGGGLDSLRADKIVENVLGVYSLPFGVALNVCLNGRDRLAPMVVEEPSVIAAASNAARMIRAAGGFEADNFEALMTAQVQLFNVPDEDRAAAALKAAEPEILALGEQAVPNLVQRGGGPRELEVRSLGEGMLVLHVYVDCKAAMGANLVNSVAEAIGPRAAELSGGQLGLRILSNLCDRRRVRVTARVDAKELVMSSKGSADSWAPGSNTDPISILEGIVQASRFAELDPYRAATHNKGIMNGVDSVVIATGNDARAVEAGAHAYAAKAGRYRPLATWKREGDQLQGELEMPLALGIVGGTLRVHPGARLALEMSGVESAQELSQLAAAVGLASNLAALRALASEGIQRGHMSLHARSVAAAAGASGDEVEQIATALCRTGPISVKTATQLLGQMRRSP